MSSFFGTQPLALNGRDWNSLYIPVITDDLCIVGTGEAIKLDNPASIKWFIEEVLQIGSVSRVDFYRKRTNPSVLSAFVHFNFWFQQSAALRSNIEANGEIRISLCEMRSIYNEQVRRFITLKENKTPIPHVVEAPKNISQIVNDNAVMERRIAELEATNAELVRRIAEMEQNLIKWTGEIDDGGPMQVSELA